MQAGGGSGGRGGGNAPKGDGGPSARQGGVAGTGLDYDSVEVFDEDEKLFEKVESTKGENIALDGLTIEPTRKLVYVVLPAGKKFNPKKRYILATKLDGPK